MINTKIYKILSSLSVIQLNRFEKFIVSPYFNKNKRITEFHSYLNSCIKENRELDTKSQIWLGLNPSESEYNDLKFRKLCNDLLERFERFLINEELQEDKLLQSNLLLGSLKKNKIKLLVDKQISKSTKVSRRAIDQSSDFHLQKYFFQKSILNLKSSYEKKEKLKEFIADLNYSDLDLNLDVFFVIEKLRHATDILTFKKLYISDIDIDIKSAITLIKEKGLEKIPAVKIYWLMHLLMNGTGKFEDYLELKTIVYQSIENFPISEKREILDVMLSFCIKDVNKGDGKALVEVVDIYDWGIDNEILLEKGVLSPTTFRNYVVCALRLGKIEKVESFIKSKSLLLEESRRQNAISFNLARLSFHKKQFEEVLEHLNKVNYDDVWYSLNSRTYMIAVYYELKEYTVLESQIDSFIAYLRREKSLTGDKRTPYLLFVKYIKKLTKFQDKTSLEKLEAALSAEKGVMNKSWVLEKIDELL